MLALGVFLGLLGAGLVLLLAWGRYIRRVLRQDDEGEEVSDGR